MTSSRPDDERDIETKRMHSSTRSVELPTHVVDQVEQRVERTDFTSLEEYVTFVLEEILERVEATGRAEDPTVTDTADEVSDDEIRSRLESLGYL